MAGGLLVSIYVFVLAMFVGVELINKVPPLLHTPLTSGSNAISGITIVGSLVVAGRLESPLSAVFGTIAIAFAMVNVVGGFMVTNRMLEMFRTKPEAGK